MPRILAIDWDRHEARGLLLSAGPTGTSVTGAWVASLNTADPDGLSGKQIGSRLAAAMSGTTIGNPVTLIGVGRDNVQMKLMTLPPAPAEELPELVRFQADREFTALGEGAALDFIPLAGDAQLPHQVLAVALNAAGMTEAREVCEALEVEVDRIPVRACAAASLVHRAGIVDAEQVTLIVNPLIDEADLVVQSGETVVLVRTVRIPDAAQSEARDRALLGEIRRTIAAVRQQLTDRQVDNVVVCAGRAAFDEGPMRDELGIRVETLDPVAQAPSGIASQGVPAESLGRFAAVLGMALSEADRRPPIVDFANVRRRVETGKIRRVHALAAAAGAVAILAMGIYLWKQLSDPTRELAELEGRIVETQSQADVYKNVTAQATAVKDWLATDVNWLDELKDFALRVRPEPLAAKEFPVANDAVMTQLHMFRPAGKDPIGGRMDFQAVAKSPAAVADLEHRLRDDRHKVTTGVGKKDGAVPGYEWSFGLAVDVTPGPDDSTTEVAP
jgi:hypothetical protein